MKKYRLLPLIILLTGYLNYLSAQTQPIISNLFTANDTIGCGPLVVTFNSHVANAIAWNWDFGNGHTSNIENPVEIYTASGIYAVTLDVTFQNGSTAQFVETDYIEVLESPNLNVYLNTNSGCVNNNQVQMTNSTQNANNFLWDFGDGFLTTDIAPSHTYSSAGNYSITLVTSNGLGCSADTTINNITIHPVNTNSIVVNGDSISCDSSHIFQASAHPSNLNMYTWNFSDGSQYAGTSVQHAFNDYNSYNLELITLDNNGCWDTTYASGIFETVKYQDDFTISDTIACLSSPIEFIADVTDASTITWNFGDGTTGNGDTVYHSYSNTGSYSVTMTVQRPNGCSTNITHNQAVQITTSPTGTIILSDTIGCIGESFNFQAGVANNSLATWILGDGSIMSGNNVIHHYADTGYFPVQFIYGFSGCTDTLHQEIHVSKPTAGFQNNPYANCSPVDIQFNNNPTTATNYQWIFSNGDSSNLQHPLISFSQPGHYDVSLIVTDLNGCSDSIFKTDALIVSDNTPDNFQPMNFQGCNPLSVSFYDFSIGGNFWNWNFGDGNTSNSASINHTYTSPGNYVVSLNTIDSLGCNIYIDTFATVFVSELEIDSLNIDLNCDSSEVEFSVNCPDCASFMWSFGDGNYSSSADTINQYITPGPHLVVFSAVSPLQCTETQIYLIDLDSCTFQSMGGEESESEGDPLDWSPEPDSIIEVTSQNTYCAPVSFTLSNPVPHAQNWNWHFGDGTVISGFQPTHIYDSIGMYQIMLTYYDSTISVQDTLYYHHVVNVVGHENDIILNPTYNCHSTELQVSSLDTLLQDYYWSVDAQIISNNSSYLDTSFLNNNQAHSLTLTTIDTNFCTYTASAGLISSGLNPQFNFDSILCLGDSLIFNHQLPSGSTYLIDYGDGNIDGTLHHVYTQPGNYPVYAQVLDSSGCQFDYFLGTIQVSDAISIFEFQSDSILCVGDTIMANALSGINDNYQWNSTNVNVIQDDTLFIGIVNNIGNYDLALSTFNNGCSSTSTVLDLYTVYNATADFSFSQDGYCLPVNTQFNDLSNGAVSWNWSLGDGTSSNLQHPLHTYYSDSTSTVSLSIVDTNGCKASITKNGIDIFNVDMQASVSSGCAPLAVSFTETSQNAVQWNWSFGDGLSDTVQNPTHTYLTDGNYDVSLVVTSADGCVDSIIISQMIEVDRVEANFTSVVSGGCAPQPAYFYDSSYNAVQWHWNFGNGHTSNQPNPIQLYHNGGNYSVELIVNSPLGCTDTMRSVNPLSILGPLSEFQIIDSTVCKGEEISFANASQSANQYTWIFGDGNSSAIANPAHIYDTSGNYTITLIAVDTNGCNDITSSTHHIQVMPLPELNAVISDSVGCNPMTVTGSVNSSGLSLSWLLNNSPVNSAGSYTTQLSTGNHTLQCVGNSSEGCVDSSLVFNVEVHPIYVPVLNAPSSVCETDDSISINSNLNFGDWYLNGTLYSGSNFSVNDLQIGSNIITQQIPTLCGYSDSSVLQVDSLITADLPNDLEICDKDSIYNLSNPNSSGYWSGMGIINPYVGDLDPSLANLGDNRMVYTLHNGSCTFTDSMLVTVSPTPHAYFNFEDEALCEGRALKLQTAQNYPGTSYNWEVCSQYDTVYSSNHQPSFVLDYGSYNISLTVSLNGCTDTFDSTSISVIDTAAPHTPEIIRSTVNDNKTVLTEWSDPKYGEKKITGYRIWRSTDTLQFTLIDSVNKDDRSYVDHDVSVNEDNYYYVIEPTNVCNVKAEENNISSSILLEYEEVEGGYLQFFWTDYYQWKEGVEYYTLEKKNQYGEWVEIQKTEGDKTTTIIEAP